MTIAMPDSVRVADLPAGYPAYLGYADGRYPTAAALAARFPAARKVILTVNGGRLDVDGIDAEPGNVTAGDAAEWVARKLAAGAHSQPAFRPVVYSSVQGEPGYGMPDVLREMARLRIGRDQVRLLSAHYGQGKHICGPRSCGLIPIDMDGTQWTDSFVSVTDYRGPVVDMSALAPDFFGAQNLTGTEKIVQELGTVRQGSTGETVRTAQGCLLARGYAIGISGVLTAGIDGVFGPLTHAAVRQLQEHAGIGVDGIVGPQTWPVLLGIA